MRVMPPGPDILSPMVQPHGEYVPGRQQNNGGGPQQNSGGGSGKPTGSD
jgi:hypothetical protein